MTTQAVCERCGRSAAKVDLWTLSVAVPPQERLERSVCVICAGEMRRFLLARPQTLQQHAIETRREDQAEVSRASRFGSVQSRTAIYIAVAAAFFALVTWLTSQ